MKRIVLLVAAILFVAGIASRVWAQQNEIAVAARGDREARSGHRAAAEAHRSAREAAAAAGRGALQDLQDDIKAQEDSVNSLRETVNSKVNLNGYYNFRFSADGSEEPSAFQQHHLGVLMAKQLGKFNFLMELELQNVPHHPEIAPELEEAERAMAEGEAARDSDISGEGQVAVENAWMEYNHNRFLSVRVGKQLSPQYWWQNHYPNLTLSTDAADLPARAVSGGAGRRHGAGVGGEAGRARPSSASATSSTLPTTTSRATAARDLRDGKSWGARGQVRFPTARSVAPLRRGGRYLSRPRRV